VSDTVLNMKIMKYNVLHGALEPHKCRVPHDILEPTAKSQSPTALCLENTTHQSVNPCLITDTRVFTVRAAQAGVQVFKNRRSLKAIRAALFLVAAETAGTLTHHVLAVRFSSG
jgi:hypothetical protein